VFDTPNRASPSELLTTWIAFESFKRLWNNEPKGELTSPTVVEFKTKVKQRANNLFLKYCKDVEGSTPKSTYYGWTGTINLPDIEAKLFEPTSNIFEKIQQAVLDCLASDWLKM
jgi:hypothetical protein